MKDPYANMMATATKTAKNVYIIDCQRQHSFITDMRSSILQVDNIFNWFVHFADTKTGKYISICLSIKHLSIA